MNKKAPLLLHNYLIEIKHKPKYKNGAYRKKYVSYQAQNQRNAMLKAVTHCEKNDLNIVGFDVVKGAPASCENAFAYFRNHVQQY
jgi:hypothetical protein